MALGAYLIKQEGRWPCAAPLRCVPRVAAVCLLVFVGPVCAFPAPGPQASGSRPSPAAEQPPQPLELGKPVERELKSGQQHVFSITPQAGQFLHVVVVQRGLDVNLALLAPGGQPLAEMDSYNGDYGPEPLSAIAQVPGAYQLIVRAPDDNPPVGRYQITLTDLRPPRPEDQTRISAERALNQGSQLYGKGTPESRASALEPWNASLPLWRILGDRYEEAVALSSIAMVYNSQNDLQKALNYNRQALALFRAVRDRSGEAFMLINLGAVYRSLGEKQKALDSYIQSLPLLRAMDDRGDEAAALSDIAWIYSSLQEDQKALESFLQALQLARVVGDRRLEAGILTDAGLNYVLLKDYKKGLEYFLQALPLHRELRDRSGEAHTLLGLGEAYSSLGDQKKAVAQYNEALAIFRALGDRKGEALALSLISPTSPAPAEKPKP